MQSETTPYQVVYLTGAPASGKTSLVHALDARIKPLKCFTYSELLSERLKSMNLVSVDQVKIRSESSRIITPLDVNVVDDLLIASVTKVRESSHVIVDSHAVTKERYGFRVTAFSNRKLALLRPTAICVLYTEPDVTIKRLREDPQGRPMISDYEAAMHTYLQSSVAIAYAMHEGITTHFLDSANSADSLVAFMQTCIFNMAY